MACGRCGGYMAREQFTDMREGIAQGTFLGGRCLNCGHIEDPVIADHRQDREPIVGRSRLPKGPASFLGGSRSRGTGRALEE